MGQLTISCIPEVTPSISQTEQLSALLSEVAAEVYRLNTAGCHVELLLNGFCTEFSIKAPVQSLPLPERRLGDQLLISQPRQCLNDCIHSFTYFTQMIFPDDKYAFYKADLWLNQLAIIERNIPAFQCRDPAPLEVMN